MDFKPLKIFILHAMCETRLHNYVDNIGLHAFLWSQKE